VARRKAEPQEDNGDRYKGSNVKRIVLADGTVRWRLRFYSGTDPDTGKREFVNKTFKRKTDADNEAARLRGLREAGEPVKISKEPFGKYLKAWLTKAKKHSLRARTYSDYVGILERYIISPPRGCPNLGKLPINRISSERIEELYDYLLEEGGLSPRTIRRIHAVIRQGLKRALARKKVGSNQADLVELPALPKRKVDTFSKEEGAAFLKAARGDRYFALWTVLLTGGLRPSEALALTWPDIDWDGGKVRVARALTRRGLDKKKYPKGWALVEPKTDNARRTVPLPPFAMRALKEWKAKQAGERLLLGSEWEDNGLVFTNDMGRPVDLANLQSRNFKRVMEAAELGTWGPEPDKPAAGPRARRPFTPKYRLYDLRHGCASNLLREGVHVKAISERLGHASSAFTLDTYAEHVQDMQEEAATKLESLWGAGN
jgi:integrase